MRWFKIIVVSLLILTGLGLAYWRWNRGPDPEAILAAIDPPEAPVLSPDEEVQTFRLPDGFRAELVASEPLVIDPVAMDWDDEGRLYVVEMRGFMPNIDGDGEDRPVGRVVVLEDLDRDGQFDQSTVFLDGLVLPRAIAVLPAGVLIGSPPDLFFCRDANQNLACEPQEKQRIADYGHEPGNVEHRENGLMPGIDGWIYNAKSDRRFRMRRGPEDFEIGATAFRGQWGIAQDDEGLLFSNHNSAFLYADLFPAQYAFRQPAIAAQPTRAGVNVDLTRGETVFGVRVAPGLNRATQRGTLRRDGRQKNPTAVSGLVLQRGDQFGPDFSGDVFIPEAGGGVVAHFDLRWTDGELEAEHRLYPDPDFGEREFLASTDERFRPVDAKVGPEGALYLIDMYRGVIQHAEYVTDHLRRYVKEQGLEAPGATGRIWRIVREDRPLDHQIPSLGKASELLSAIDSPNAWLRDRASRRIVFEDDVSLAAALEAQQDLSVLGRVSRLHTLSQLNALSVAIWEEGLQDDSAIVRRTALRVRRGVETSAGRNLDTLQRTAAMRGIDDPDPGVRLEAIHALGDLAPAERPLGRLLAIGREATPLSRQAVLSGLSGLEQAALAQALDDPGNGSAEANEWLSELAAVAYFSFVTQNAPDDQAGVLWLLDRVADQPDSEKQKAVLRGIQKAQRLPGHKRVVLASAHRLLAPPNEEDGHRGPVGDADTRALLEVIRAGVTWPGDPRPGGARPLTPEEDHLRIAGERFFLETCATCHGPDGQGQTGLAPPLVDASWVRDADDWLARIILDGLTGPIQVQGQEWNFQMPGHRANPELNDDTLAGLITHLRRSWGHADEPASPSEIARIRAESGERKRPWTSDELLGLEIDHRLDRYAGFYEIPFIGIELNLEREGPLLRFGRRGGDTAPLAEVSEGFFVGEGVEFRFDSKTSGPQEKATIRLGSDSVGVVRVAP